MRMADSSEGGWLTLEHYENYAVNLDFAAEREGLQNRYSLYSQPSGDRFISETSKSLSVHSRSLKIYIFAWTSLNQSIIEICHAHQQFLGFQWPLGGRGHRHYCFTLFHFGLSSAPYLFIIFFRPLVRNWRGAGIHLVLYLVDMSGLWKGFITTQLCSEIVESDLVSAGLAAYSEKSVWTPVQELEWLDLSWDLSDATLSILQPRIDRMLSALKFSTIHFLSPIVLLRLLFIAMRW